jgi:hypothetical protein
MAGTVGDITAKMVENILKIMVDILGKIWEYI